MRETTFRVVIIHGSFGNAGENWFPWLAEQVRDLGNEVVVPTFPTPEGQSLDAWRHQFDKRVGALTRNTVLVGHSLGPGFILNLLEASPIAIKGTFLVSGFLGRLGLPEFDAVNESFVCRSFDWNRIRRHAGEVHLYHSDNDPYVPLEKGQELAANLRASLTVIKGGGHINAAAGFTTFPLLLDDLTHLIRARRSR